MTIAAPEDGATVESPVQVSMEADGFTLEPAGAPREGAGHLHLMVDTDCLAPGEQIPQDRNHRHLVDGASQTQLQLSVGEHSLCVQAGDGVHKALDLTDEVKFRVAAAGTTSEAGGDRHERNELWDGTYEGTIVWECPGRGAQRGRLRATIAIAVYEDGRALMGARHTVTGSCAGPRVGSKTTDLSIRGRRTDSGFTFPSTIWGPPGSVMLRVDGDRARGRLRGSAPGPATITLDFDVVCKEGC